MAQDVGGRGVRERSRDKSGTKKTKKFSRSFGLYQDPVWVLAERVTGFYVLKEMGLTSWRDL